MVTNTPTPPSRPSVTPTADLLTVLISDFLDASIPLHALAKRHNLPLLELLDLLESPEFQSALDRIERLNHRKLEALRTSATAAALESCEQSLSSDDEGLRHKAAAVILRHTGRAPKPAPRTPSASEGRSVLQPETTSGPQLPAPVTAPPPTPLAAAA